MPKTIIVACFLITRMFSYSQGNIDVLHYQYSIELNDNNDTIYGKAEIKFVAKKGIDQIEFDLSDIHPGSKKGMLVTKASVPNATPFGNGTTGNIFSHVNDKLSISAWKQLTKGDTLLAIIEYKGIPSDGLIISKNKYGDRTFFADNWPNRAHNWIPCVDDPGDKASFEFFVTAPSHYQVISNGFKAEEKELRDNRKLTHWIENISLSTKVMVIGVAKFAVKEFADSPAGIPVSAWVYPRDSVKGFQNYSVATGILKFLSAYIGPYPYNKLANVQSKTIFGGMENASAIFYDESSASSSRTVESLLAHEITHQWFGDMASEKSFPHLWLSEGFATYLTHIYIESKYGTDSLEKEMRKDRSNIIDFAKESGRPVVDSVSPLMRLLNANSYQKGGWVLHMLRRQLGDSVFHAIIRNYYSAYAGKNADTRDFQKICENVSGKNLQIFFQQWLYTPGLPKLDVQWKYDENAGNLIVTVNQLQDNLFQFPLEIQVQDGSGKLQLKTLPVNKKNQPFTIPVKERITKINLDPHTSLLFEGTISPVN
ncbi:MAG: M1 family metallopeptidase [Bacteroidota bacterium]|nr:M1 family metallopeptidase [Bacteroidota bacterium]